MTETNQLDAHDALMLMAEAFDGADERGESLIDGFRTPYLCNATDHLQTKGRLADGVRQSIRAAIEQALKDAGREFLLFPYGREGARQRAAWCRSEAAKLRPVESWNGKTAVRCWRDGDGTSTIAAYVSESEGFYFDRSGYIGRAADESCRLKNYSPTRLDPDAALALLARWPDSQRKLREMFAAHPVVDVVPATRVRCWKWTNDDTAFFAYSQQDQRCDLYFNAERPEINLASWTCDPTRMTEITTAAALDLLRDWPEGRERFLQYCREHPPEAAKPKTVADVLREMPVGTRFTRPNWIAQGWCEKLSQGEFLWCDFTRSDMSGFSMSDRPHDDPEHGIILLPAAEPVEQPKPVEQPAGVVVTREWLSEVAEEFEMASIAHHYHVLDGTSVSVKFRDNCARLAADARRKAGG